MKKLKLVLVVTVTLLFLGMGSVSAQEQPTKTVLINTLEVLLAGTINSNMVIVDASGNANTIPLERNKGALEKNAITIHKELEKWKQEGYKITHLSTSGDGLYRYTTIILEK